jgi:hypothetical protein
MSKKNIETSKINPASAPVLLEALTYMLSDFKEMVIQSGLDINNMPPGSWKTAIDKAEAAIKKAIL